MSDQQNKIKTTVELDASQARTEINKLNGGATASQDKLNASLKQSKTASVDLDAATGGLGKRFSGLLAPMKGIANGFKTIGGAIALSGIGLLVTSVVALKAAFSRSEEGQNKFAKIMGVIGAVTGQLLDVLADVGDKIMWVFEHPKQAIENFTKLLKQNIINRFEGLLELVPKLGKAIGLLFEGKFSAAGKVAADAVGKVALGMESVTDSINGATKAFGEFIKETEREARIAANIANIRAAADKKERELIVARAKANAERADLLVKAVDKENFSLEQRIAFLKQAGDLEESITNQEIEAGKLRLAAKQAENALGLSTKADLDEEAQLRANLIDLETAKLSKAKETTAQLIALKTEEKAARDKEKAETLAEEEEAKKKKEEADKVASEKAAAELEANTVAQNELDQLEIERLQEKGDNTLDLELALLERKRMQDVSAADLTAKEIELINKKSQIAKDKIGDLENKALEAKNKAEYENNVNTAIDSFGIAQEVAVAKMIMNAPEAIGNSFTQAAKSYAPPLSLAMGALGAAGVVVPIIKGLSDIKKTRFSKSKKGAPSGNISASTGGGSASTAITPELIDSVAANNSARLGYDSSIGGRAGASAASNIMGGSSSSVNFSEARYREFQNQVAFKEEKTTI
jgi:hypothetical protein